MSEIRKRSWAEPFKIKMVEPLTITTREQRERALEAAGYNTFLLRSEDVYIDLLTDSGTNAMSDRQWAGMMMGDDAYAGSRNFYHLEDAVRRYYGYRFLVPTHQGRAAEHLISKLLIRPGDFVPGNMYFTTTRLHQELAGATFVDVIIDEAHDPVSPHPFKGNVDIGKLEALVERVGAANPLCLRRRDGQHDRRAADRDGEPACRREFCGRLGIESSSTRRAIENAWFIQQREPGMQGRSVASILKEMCSLTDGCTMSAKKDLPGQYRRIPRSERRRGVRRGAQPGRRLRGAPHIRRTRGA
jgi:tyrosine phenol-lyase